jgi:hypothetical protein
MRRRPNYAQERAEKNRRKAARREERLQAKAERSQKARAEREGATGTPGPEPVDSGSSE